MNIRGNASGRTLALVVLGVALWSTPALAQRASIFPFLRSNISARAAGLGGATVAIVDDAANVVVNPAVLATCEAPTVSGTFVKHPLDINAGFVSYQTDVSSLGPSAVTIGYINYGTFDSRSRDGDKVGTFGASDIAVAFTTSNDIDSMLSYGVTAKVLHSTFNDRSSTAMAVDAGLVYQIPAKRVTLGFSILNLGTQLSTYDGTSDRLPLDVRLGVSHRLRGLPMLINFSLNHLADDAEGILDRFANFSVGGELYLGRVVQARLSYDNSSRNISGVNIASQLSGLSAGIGLRLPSLTFDYAYSALGAAAILHRISVSVPLQ